MKSLLIHLKTLYILVSGVLFFYSSIEALAQKPKEQQIGHLELEGMAKKNGSGISEVSIEIKNDKGEITRSTAKDNGYFLLTFPIDQDFILTYTRKGCLPRTVEVSSKVPESEKYIIYSYKFNLELFDEIERIPQNLLDMPATKIRYDFTVQDFEYDKIYTDNLKNRLIKAREESKIALASDSLARFMMRRDSIFRIDSLKRAQFTADSLYKVKSKADSLARIQYKNDSLFRVKLRSDSLFHEHARIDSLRKINLRTDSLIRAKVISDSLVKAKIHTDSLLVLQRRMDSLSSVKIKKDSLVKTKGRVDSLAIKKLKTDTLSKSKTKTDSLARLSATADSIARVPVRTDTIRRSGKGTSNLPQLGADYAEGITEEKITEPKRTIFRMVVNRDEEITALYKVVTDWGGVFYFKNDASISVNLYNLEVQKAKEYVKNMKK